MLLVSEILSAVETVRTRPAWVWSVEIFTAYHIELQGVEKYFVDRKERAHDHHEIATALSFLHTCLCAFRKLTYSTKREAAGPPLGTAPNECRQSGPLPRLDTRTHFSEDELTSDACRSIFKHHISPSSVRKVPSRSFASASPGVSPPCFL